VALTDFQTMVDDLVRDVDARIADAERDRAIERAVMRYGADRPRVLVEDLVAAGGHYLDLPTDWESEFSALESVEYPIGDVPPTFLENGAYDLYEDPTETRIMLDSSATATATFRVRFSAPHTVDATTDTVPASHREAVCSLAAGGLLLELAGIHAAESDEAIMGAPHVEHGNKSGRYARQGKALRARYFEILEIKPGRVQAAGAVVDWDASDSRGRDRLTHPRRFR
jgi:hypothetical protein